MSDLHLRRYNSDVSFLRDICKSRKFLRTQTVSAARAEAEKIRLLGDAEAHALEAVGVSEAERMRMKAAVYKKYGDAAILNITLNALPKVGDTSIFKEPLVPFRS